LLNVYKYNIEHNNPLIPIFEIQKIYQANQEFGEYNLTILTPNKYFFDRTNNSQIIFNINGLYGVLNELLNRVFENENINIEASNSITFLYKNETVSIKYENKIIGYIGKLTTTALKPFDINEPIYLLTINLNDLLKSYSSKKFILQPINKKQLVQKDITIDCFNKKQSLAPIINQIAALNYIKNVEFVGKFINETKYTYTIHLTFNPDSDNSREKINENLVFINKLINDYLKN
jgi:phenylalanyl-tRNA synthetase beta subunit